VGAKESIIGVEKAGPINLFLTQIPDRFEIPEEGVVQVNAVLLKIDDKTGRAKEIERVDDEISV